MSKIGFRIGNHSVRPGVEIVEIILDGQMIAAIYPDKDCPQGIKLVSAHFAGELTHSNQFPDGIKMDTGEHILPPIPTINVIFDPRKYRIEGQMIIREK